MGYVIIVLNWDAYMKRTATTRDLGTLFLDERDRIGFMASDAEDLTFCKMAWVMESELDVPWMQEFLSIFSFVHGIRNGEDDRVIKETRDRFGNQVDSFIPNLEMDPKQVRAFLTVWKEINFKRDLKLIPKKYRKNYRAMAEIALEYKQIMKRAAAEGKGMVVGITLD